MYAAGIAVMFLLFSATGAGGSLLEENEAGTLDRLLSSKLSLTQLLAGKWTYITILGCVQLTTMFVWAQIAFGVDLLGNLAGFAIMCFATAAATSSLALCLAVSCRSRAQLNAISIVLILTMSCVRRQHGASVRYERRKCSNGANTHLMLGRSTGSRKCFGTTSR